MIPPGAWKKKSPVALRRCLQRCGEVSPRKDFRRERSQRAGLTESALLAVPLYTVTASDRARTLEVCRSTYAVAA